MCWYPTVHNKPKSSSLQQVGGSVAFVLTFKLSNADYLWKLLHNENNNTTARVRKVKTPDIRGHRYVPLL